MITILGTRRISFDVFYDYLFWDIAGSSNCSFDEKSDSANLSRKKLRTKFEWDTKWYHHLSGGKNKANYGFISNAIKFQ